MARIRSIKPDFWTDPDVVAMPMAARLFFIGCWNQADDYGVLRDDPERLRLQIMPADPIDADGIVDELVERRHLVRMTAPDGTKVLVVRTFCVHQKIDKRAVGRWGEPSDFQPSPPNPDTSPPTTPDPTPGKERTGREGTSLNTCPIDPAAAPQAPSDEQSSAKPTAYHPDFETWYRHYPRKVGKKAAERAWLTAKKQVGTTKLLDAIQAHALGWHHAGTNERYIPNPSTWLSQGRYDDPPPTRQTPDTRPAANRAKVEASLARMTEPDNQQAIAQ